MNSALRVVRPAATCALAFAFAYFLELRDVPLLVAGPNLRVLAGESRDPHLLTGWFWPHFAAGYLQTPWTLFVLCAALFAIATGLFTFTVERVRGPLAGVLAGCTLAFCPLAVAAFIDPLGAESVLAFCLFLILAGDVAGAYTLGTWVRRLLPAALLAQDPLSLPVAFVYCALLARRAGRSEAIFATGAVGAVCLVRALSGPPAFDAVAGPPALVAVGIVCLLLLPAALFGWKRGLYIRAGFQGGAFAEIAGLAGAALLGAMFSWTGDPSAAWLYAVAGLLIALFGSVPAGSRGAFRFVATVCLVAIAGGAAVGIRAQRFIPSIDIATQSVAILDAAKKAGDAPLCLVSSPAAKAHVLAGDAFIRKYLAGDQELSSVAAVTECPRSRRKLTYLVTVDGRGVTDWDDSGLELTLTTAQENRARFVLTDAIGEVNPKTHVNLPGGFGAFGNTEPTAGDGVTTMTITAGFSYIYRCVDTSAPGRLVFLGANPIPNGDVARFSVRTSARGTAPAVIFTHDFPGRRVGRKPDWRSFSVPFRAGAPCTDITFSVESPSGQVTGSWATFIAMVTERD